MLPIVAAIIAGVVGIGVGFLGGVIYRKKVGEAEIGSAEAQARKILEDGIKAAETKKKEALLEAKEEILQTKNEFEKELKDRRNLQGRNARPQDRVRRKEGRKPSEETQGNHRTQRIHRKDQG